MSLKSHRSSLVEYQDEKVVLSGGSGSENVVVGEERPESKKWFWQRGPRCGPVSACRF